MENSYSSSKNYFHNLDGLRFIASLIIIIFHIEDIKSRQNLPSISIIRGYSTTGNYDVSLFFVLSGFLITYLLLVEKEAKGSIHLKAYFVRRTLRIWPLYYFILILGFFVLPPLDNYFGHTYSSNINKHFWVYFTGCFLMLSPLVRGASGLPLTVGPIWSVGVEELFYYCWPLFLRKTGKYVWFLIAVIVVTLVLRNGFFLCDDFFDLKHSCNKIFVFTRAFIMEYRISCMAIGGIGAYLVVFDKKRILTFLYRKDFQWLLYGLTIGLLLLKTGGRAVKQEGFPSVFHEFYSVLFTIIIINLATNPKSIIRLDFKWMTYLGRISYGLYLYHPIMRIFSLELTEHLFKEEKWGWQMNVCLYVFTLSFTIITAVLSYEFFEKRFLNLKKKFV